MQAAVSELVLMCETSKKNLKTIIKIEKNEPYNALYIRGNDTL